MPLSLFSPTHVCQTMVLSKMTAAVLEDLEYIVDASAVRFDKAYAVGLSFARIQPTMPFTHPPLAATATIFLSSRPPPDYVVGLLQFF